jgi:outer membrane protein assembly factor BamE
MPTPAQIYRLALLSLTLTLGACAQGPALQNTLNRVLSPYQPDILQGNVITQERVALLRVGMGRDEVNAILGTPLLRSVFHADRWDYVFSFQRQGEPVQQRRLTLFFKDGALASFDGDTMPKEAEFVQSIAREVPTIDPTKLENAAVVKNAPDAAPAASAATTPEPTPKAKYPPLQSGTGLIQ